MKALSDLFSTDYGLMSIIGLGFIVCMGGFFTWLFTRKPPQVPEASRAPDAPKAPRK